MVFFITTDTNSSVEESLRHHYHFESNKKTHILKQKNLKAVFIGCQKVELEKHIVFIYGNAFPSKNRDLKSCLEEVAQKGTGQERMNGNFNLIIFNKDDNGNSSFSIYGDRHGSLPIFFSDQAGVIKVSSFFELILQSNRDYRFNESALLDYLCLGYVLPGESLWKSVQMLSKNKCLNVFPLKKQWFLKSAVSKNREDRIYYSSLKEAGEAFVVKLKETLADGFNFLNISLMDLTGGTDTRILISCMNELQRKGITYRTFESPFWSSTDNDLIVAKKIAEEFNLSHFPVKHMDIQVNLPVSYLLMRRYYPEKTFRQGGYPEKTFSGIFGSELFGGAILNTQSALDYRFSDRIDKIKDRLFQSVMTLSDYKRIGSPWEKLTYKITHSKNPFKEQDLVQQILLRSPWTSIYASNNSEVFITPYYYIKYKKVCPYVDTRMIDCFFKLSQRIFIELYLI